VASILLEPTSGIDIARHLIAANRRITMEEIMHDTNDRARGNHRLRSFMIGAAFGAGLALLLAPASGADTRRRLGRTARKLRDRASDQIHEMRHDAEHALEAGRDAYRRTRGDLKAGEKSAAHGSRSHP
jgi:gas vesicle protein